MKWALLQLFMILPASQKIEYEVPNINHLGGCSYILPRNSQFFTTDGNNTEFIDLQEGFPRKCYNGAFKAISGRLLALNNLLAGRGKRMHSINIHDGDNRVVDLTGHTSWINRVRFVQKDNRCLVISASSDKRIKIWDITRFLKTE